jgi:plastocyanin
MISRWLIFFSILFSIPPLCGATVTGRVELRDSRDPAVRNRGDYSGVVLSLTPVHGAQATAADEHHFTILQKDKTFTPHVLAIPVGSVVDFPNADPIFHNAFSSYSGQVFDIGLYPPGSTRSVRFTRVGIVRVFCNIHSSMSAMIAVLATPYFAITKRDGSFEIPNVPPGEYDLSVLHERATEAALGALGRKVAVGQETLALPPIGISEAGYLPIPHKNKYGHDYPPESDGHLTYPRNKK